MTILNNAIDSIALGVEDFESSDTRRLISCTRNLFAGILLLFKHKLSMLSPVESDEVLIKQKVLPAKLLNNEIEWIGKGKKTVDVIQIRERFDSLNIVIDWNRIEKINKFRNDIEHYFSNLSQDSVRTLIADSFIIIRDFIRIYLEEDPLDLLGSKTWNSLIDVAEVYESEKKECVDHIAATNWKFQVLQDALIECTCTECGSGLIDVINPTTDRWEAKFKCRSCGENWDFEAIAELSINEFFLGLNHLSVMDGGDPETISCPECGHDTYVLGYNVCVICEESFETTCQRCHIAIPPEEINDSGFCGYCNHMINKDD